MIKTASSPSIMLSSFDTATLAMPDIFNKVTALSMALTTCPEGDTINNLVSSSNFCPNDPQIL